MKSKLFFLLLALLPVALRAAEGDLISSLAVASMHNANGTVNNDAFGGGPALEALFDGALTPGSYIGPNNRAQNGCYVLLDFSSVKPGGYFVTDVAVSQVNAYAYSVYYWSVDDSDWTAVDDATGVTATGTSTFSVNKVTTRVKLVIDQIGGWTQTISEFQVWGLDPADVTCSHGLYTDWEYVSGSAMCTTVGRERRKCLLCGEEFERDSELYPPLGHDYVSTLESSGSSSEPGRGTISCSRCDLSIVFNVPLDLSTLGGVAGRNLVQFTDLTVTSTGNIDWGVNPGNLIDNIWDMSWCNYWYANSSSADEYVQFDFGTEIDLTKIDFSVPKRAQMVRFYRVEDGAEDLIAEIEVPNSGNADYLRFKPTFRGVSLSTLRMRIDANGQTPTVCELRPYGTVKGAGLLDVLRTRILLY